MLRTATAICVMALALGLAGCSGNPFSTASTSSALAAPEIQNTPENRLTQVAWTAQRAERCHFYLDQGKLKANYLAYEAAQGATAQSQQNMGPAYDKIRLLIAQRIEAPDYCAPTVNAEVEADLARYLAGDFSPRAVKSAASEGTSWLTPAGQTESATAAAKKAAAN